MPVITRALVIRTATCDASIRDIIATPATALIGPRASGKSVALHAIVGEAKDAGYRIIEAAGSHAGLDQALAELIDSVNKAQLVQPVLVAIDGLDTLYVRNPAGLMRILARLNRLTQQTREMRSRNRSEPHDERIAGIHIVISLFEPTDPWVKALAASFDRTLRLTPS